MVLVPALLCLAAAQEALTNDSILKLVKSGLGENLIIGMVQGQPGKYSMTPDEVVKLKEAGVSQKILAAMAGKGTGGAGSSSGSVKIELKTPVRLSVEEAISSKTAKAGDAFKLVAAEDVAINGRNIAVEGQLSVGGGGVGFGRFGKEAEIEKGRLINAVVAAETEIKY
jgi:hypothetical protein